jgi:hypothetical protein
MQIRYEIIIIVFLFVILASIQYTLLQILDEIRRIRQKSK